MDNPLPVVLTIAGSDSGGGAGIQADLKTFHAFGVYGCSAVTAVTAQNTVGVTAVHPVPEPVVLDQIAAVVDDLAPAAVKSGMLATASLVRTVAAALEEHGLPNYVLDPVMVSTSGHRLLDEEGVDSLTAALLPLATVITPNIPEAEILTGRSIGDAGDLLPAAEALLEMGPGAVLIKGGHLRGPKAVDLLLTAEGERTWSRPKLDGNAGHGTGCTLSAALAASLARGVDLAEASDIAIDFVARALASAPGLGSGRGPINHFVPASPAR